MWGFLPPKMFFQLKGDYSDLHGQVRNLPEQDAKKKKKKKQDKKKE